MTGTVTKFSPSKGYGFIQPDGESTFSDRADVFVHHSHIENGQRFKVLTPGQRVEFEMHRASKGWRAERVKVLSDNPQPSVDACGSVQLSTKT